MEVIQRFKHSCKPTQYSTYGSPNSPPKDHFAKDATLDETIRTRFGATLAAARCELFAWRATPEGRLAEVLVLDQFSRNVYRDTPQAFAQDALAPCVKLVATQVGLNAQACNAPNA